MHVYEINTWVWLHGLSLQHGKTITLSNVPDENFAYLTGLGVDAIWMMGMWTRSPEATRIGAEHPDLQNEFRRSLSDFDPDNDVSGSPYAVFSYTVDENFGGREGLAIFRKRLQDAGLKLILDYVPNHVAVDHHWLTEHPDALVPGRDAEAIDEGAFIKVGEHVFARGRDPYFAPWTDTAQLNAFSDKYRHLAIETLTDIGSQCDGVRCDMAMLLVSEIFERTWTTERAGAVPEVDFWKEVIPAVRATYPDFVFMAEVYWDMEYTLQQHGFDYCYDKRLYDRMVNETPASVNGHLYADLSYQEGLIRFIENHDEPRALTELGRERSRMAAVIMAATPGGKLWHEGQFEGYQIKLPVQLGRRAVETPDLDLQEFYLNLIKEVQQDVYRQGHWQLRNVNRAWDENATSENMIAFTWVKNAVHKLIVVNFSDFQSQGLVSMPDFGLEGKQWKLTDHLDHDATYERDGDSMHGRGLYIDLAPWQAHIFSIEAL